jgi:hypothetical protein
MRKNTPEATSKIEKEVKQTKSDSLNQTPGIQPKTAPNLGFNMQNIRSNDAQPATMGMNGSQPNYMNLQGLLNPGQMLNLEMFGGLSPLQLNQMVQMGQIPMRYTSIEGMMPGYMPMNMNLAMMRLGINNQMNMNQNIRPYQSLFA